MFKIERQNDIKLALISMLRVIHALILREVKVRFGRLKIGYLWALLEPVLFICVLAIIFTIRRDNTVYGMPLLIFLLTGVIPFLLFRNIMNKTIVAAQSNIALLHFPQIHPFEIVIARSILEFVTVIIVFIILSLLMHLSGLALIEIESPLKIIVILLAVSLLGFSTGVAIGAWTPIFPILEQIAHIFIGRPLFLLSGIFFTVEMVPVWLREYLLLNPLFHLIEMFRSAFFISFESKYTDPFYVLSYILVLFFIALVSQRALRRYVIET
jgi:capsular polysaccharide transport system permease protein